MEKNRERYVKNRDEIEELQKKIIKIDLGIQEIEELLIIIKINQQYGLLTQIIKQNLPPRGNTLRFNGRMAQGSGPR